MNHTAQTFVFRLMDLFLLFLNYFEVENQRYLM
jgi:hypothetical protein